jgi:hypothetical protein
VKWKGGKELDCQWRKVEDLNHGGGLAPWLDYEAAIMRRDPSKASALTKEELPRHTGSADRGQDIIPHEMRPRDQRKTNNRPQTAATTTPTPRLEPEEGTTPPQRPSDTPSATPTAPPAAAAPGTRRSTRQASLQSLQTAEHVCQYETEDAVDVGKRPLRVLVLFSGSGSVESAIRALYPNNVVDIVSVDSDPKSAATLVTDINEFVREQLFTWRPGHFHILWASPPCTQYSYAKSIGERKLDTYGRHAGISRTCLSIVVETNPGIGS